MLSKVVSSTIFKVFGMTRPGIEPRSPGPLANTLTAGPIMMAKVYELHFSLLPHPPYSPDLAPSDYWLFVDLKKICLEKRFGSNEEVISETEVYFEAKDKLFSKKGIELLEKCWN